VSSYNLYPTNHWYSFINLFI